MKRLKSEIERLLSYVENGPVNWPEQPDYEAHATLIAAQKDDPPRDLVKYMFRRSPQMALVVFLRIYLRDLSPIRELAWAQHVVSDAVWRKEQQFLAEFKQIERSAIAHLEKLSQHDQWWVRLYVAEIAATHAELRTAQLIERLRKDENQLVREVVVQKMDE